MFSDIRLLIGELKKNPMATICGLLIASVVSLVMYIVSQDKKHDTKEEQSQAKVQALQDKLLATERFWYDKFEAVRLQQIQEVKDALERQTRIEAEQKRLTKKAIR